VQYDWTALTNLDDAATVIIHWANTQISTPDRTGILRDHEFQWTPTWSAIDKIMDGAEKSAHLALATRAAYTPSLRLNLLPRLGLAPSR
jgi:hypothetical protein